MLWQLWRQDDNGQKFLVDTFASAAEATQALETLEARQHKQIYWLATTRDESLAASPPRGLIPDRGTTF